MFKKVETELLGVVENMSYMEISGEVPGSKNADIVINGEKIATNETGKFNLKFDLFKRGGGQTESTRLDIPLLAEVPYSHELMESIDSGEPIVFYDKKSPVSKIFLKLAQQIASI
jgi:ATP-binding protein involved in chromosome partitioning